MTQLAIKAENIWKQYKIHHSMQNHTYSLRYFLNSPISKFFQGKSKDATNLRSEKFLALQNVSFEITHGESVGLIGRNGAGKSTLLKILSRITRPTRGKIVIYERVNSLLEIGTGFNAELSGKDNIFLNGSFLGMKPPEIKKKYDEIVAFSEIEQFIDTPVKYYSSGMYVRLAFSVAVNLTPELLLLDEVLSVGDAGFQKKSNDKMKELLGSGATIILVSHNEMAIKDLCKRVIWLEDGRIQMDGASQDVFQNYNEYTAKRSRQKG